MTISDWSDMFGDTITIEPFSSQDGHKKPTYGAGVVYNARVTGKQAKRVSDEGEDIFTTKMVWLETTSVPGMKDRITLPAGHSPTQPPIKDIKVVSDENGGVHHIKLFL